jgi:hypothetical protein
MWSFSQPKESIMSRIDFSALPLSADQARAARNYFAWSQATAAEKSGLPLHKLKRFETGNYVPDEAFLGALRSYYEKSGYTFDDTVKPGAKAKQGGLVFPAGVVDQDEPTGAQAQPIGAGRASQATIHHMRIAITDEGEMGQLLDMIEANEDKAKKLLAAPVESGLWAGFSDATEKRHAQVVRLMADNGVMFGRLFGRDIGGKPNPAVLAGSKKPATGAELLHRVQADVHMAATGDADAKERQSTSKEVASVRDAIGLS